MAIGVVFGVVIASRYSSGPMRVRELENQIRGLKENQREYKDSVSDHFSMTAELVQQMTESYRDVYQHLASGAQDLCSAEVANKLLPADTDAVFDTSNSKSDSDDLIPPRDYAAKQSPDQKGALSEDFGIDKTKDKETETGSQESDEDEVAEKSAG
ncbi:MAG: YhcB family protein [Pseudohongiellaceae bacterium]